MVEANSEAPLKENFLWIRRILAEQKSDTLYENLKDTLP